MTRIALVASLFLCTIGMAGAALAASLEVGAKAPDFALMGSDGRIHTLAEHAGKRGVVLAWFPKAFTPG